VVAHW